MGNQSIAGNGVSLITAGYRRIPQDTAGSLDIGLFNGIYHIITWNRHFIINNSKYLRLFFVFVGKNSHAINQLIKKTHCHIPGVTLA